MSFRFRRLKEVFGAEEGTFLAIFGVSLVAFLGIVALSFDYGRIDATQSELQSFADEIALAAAGELDGNNDSITRATAAAANLVSETQTFGDQTQTQSGSALKTLDSNDYQLFFYDQLPTTDTASMSTLTALNPSTQQAQARYVRVEVYSHTVGLTFGAAFKALSGNNGSPVDTVSARAVAGFTQYACDLAGLMFCAPSGFDATNWKGRMINLRSGGGGTAFWGPGDFGFLDLGGSFPLDPNGPCGNPGSGNERRCLLAAESNRSLCFPINGVDVQPGQANGITNVGINVRFDMYSGGANNYGTGQNASWFQPAPNVIKGITTNGNGCAWTNGQISATAPSTIALPRDDCMVVGNAAYPCTPNARFGNGTWDKSTYIATNYTQHGGSAPSNNGTSRWDMYNAEIAAISGTPPRILPSGAAETGLAHCSNAGPTNDPYRRVMVAAAIDCTANPIQGSASGVPVQEFVQLFLTEPVGADASSPPNFDVWAEVVGTAGGAGQNGAGSVVHDVVQLYR